MRHVSNVASAVAVVLMGTIPTDVGRGAITTDSQVGGLAPTPLEAFVARPGAKVVWSRTIGHIEGTGARATVVAIAVEDESNTPRVMHGLRIDLAHLKPNPNCDLRFHDWVVLCGRPNAAVYLEEDRLERVRARLVEIGAAEVHPGTNGGITNYRTNGSHPGFGLIISGYTLDGHRPEELTFLLARGMATLKDAPR